VGKRPKVGGYGAQVAVATVEGDVKLPKELIETLFGN
jgi:hypothetical protein